MLPLTELLVRNKKTFFLFSDIKYIFLSRRYTIHDYHNNRQDAVLVSSHQHQDGGEDEAEFWPLEIRRHEGIIKRLFFLLACYRRRVARGENPAMRLQESIITLPISCWAAHHKKVMSRTPLLTITIQKCTIYQGGSKISLHCTTFYIFSPNWYINNHYPSQQLNVVLRYISWGKYEKQFSL